jgi:hypothetical protein
VITFSTFLCKIRTTCFAKYDRRNVGLVFGLNVRIFTGHAGTHK